MCVRTTIHMQRGCGRAPCITRATQDTVVKRFAVVFVGDSDIDVFNEQKIVLIRVGKIRGICLGVLLIAVAAIRTCTTMPQHARNVVQF